MTVRLVAWASGMATRPGCSPAERGDTVERKGVELVPHQDDRAPHGVGAADKPGANNEPLPPAD